MLNIAAAMRGAIAAPVLSCAVAGTAFAEPPAELTQRPGATDQPSALAEPRSCMPHDGASEKLHTEFGENVLGRGISSDGTLVEIFMAPSGAFTVIKTTPGGMSCVVDFGEGWQTLNQLEAIGLTPEHLKNMTARR
jgi:hypothetical protein